MRASVPSHGLKRSWRSCPRQMNASNKTTLSSMKTQCDYLNGWIKNSHIGKNLTQRMVNPGDIGMERRGEEEEESKHVTNIISLDIGCLTQFKNTWNTLCESNTPCENVNAEWPHCVCRVCRESGQYSGHRGFHEFLHVPWGHQLWLHGGRQWVQ